MSVHVWEIPLVLESTRLRQAAARLTEAETERANRLINPADGARKIASQWATREILSFYLERTPEQVNIRPDPEGKPRLVEAGPWHFNLSHSADWGLLALAREEVGVDVEDSSRKIECLQLARRFFSQSEANRVERLHPTEQALLFFRIWTLKEAYVKATGRGLRLPLDNFCTFDEQRGWGLFDLESQPLSCWRGQRLEPALDLPDCYCAALVCASEGALVQRYRYQPFAQASELNIRLS